MNDKTDKIMTRLKRQALIAVIAIAGSAAGLSMLPISGAVLAPGKIVIENSLQKVQHHTGGTVAQIFVREGGRVSKGQVVIRLDDTQLKAQLAVIETEQASLRAKVGRLRAEREELPEIAAADSVGADARALQGEASMLRSRREAVGAREGQLRERIFQARQEVIAIADQRISYDRQLSIARKELEDLSGLMAKGLIQRPRITALEREVARIEGALQDSFTKEAQAKGKVAESEMQLGQLRLDVISEASRELQETERRLGELHERRIAAADQLARVDIIAPEGGQVHQLTVHTIGGVVTPAEPLMMIVPESADLIIEASIQPSDIDEVAPGQSAAVRLSAFNNATTPEIFGEVTRVSGDLTKDPQTGATYYTVGISVPKSEVEKLGKRKLVPGMPAEAHLKTTERSVGSFLVKPVIDQARRAMREG